MPESTEPNAASDAQPTPKKSTDPACVSTQRRQFFREILGLGLEGAENIARAAGKRVGDALEAARSTEPNEDPPPIQIQKPDGQVSRDDQLDL